MNTRTTLSIALAFCCQILLSQINLNQGLIAAYPMDGSSLDTAGGHHGTTVGGVTLDSNRFGVPNKAYYFNGTTSEIEVLHDPVFQGSSTMTFSWVVWFKPDTTNGYLVIKNLDVLYKDWGMSFGNGHLYLTVENGGSAFTFSCSEDTPSVNVGQWNFAVVTVDAAANTIEIWNNNQKTKSCFNLPQNNIGTTNANVEIGSVGYANLFYKGAIDYVLIYNRVITPAEIGFLHNLTGGIGLESFTNTPFSLYPNPTEDFTFLDGDAESLKECTLYDLSGNLLKKLNFENQNENNWRIDLRQFSAGTYILETVTEQGTFSNVVVKK